MNEVPEKIGTRLGGVVPPTPSLEPPCLVGSASYTSPSVCKGVVATPDATTLISPLHLPKERETGRSVHVRTPSECPERGERQSRHPVALLQRGADPEISPHRGPSVGRPQEAGCRRSRWGRSETVPDPAGRAWKAPAVRVAVYVMLTRSTSTPWSARHWDACMVCDYDQPLPPTRAGERGNCMTHVRRLSYRRRLTFIWKRRNDSQKARLSIKRPGEDAGQSILPRSGLATYVYSGSDLKSFSVAIAAAISCGAFVVLRHRARSEVIEQMRTDTTDERSRLDVQQQPILWLHPERGALN